MCTGQKDIYVHGVQSRMDKITKAKAHLDLNLMRDLNGNKKYLYNILSAKGRLGKTHC